MGWIVANMRWIMVVSGVLTGTMLHAAVAPQAALRQTFGETLEGPLAEIVVRNWAVLIAMGGAMLIYGAFDRPSRPVVLAYAGGGKVAFIGLVLAQGSRFLAQPVAVAVAVDAVMVALFTAYLIGARGRA